MRSRIPRPAELRDDTDANYVRLRCRFGAPVELIGLLVAAVTIIGIVVKLLAGALFDLFGFRRLMMVGALVKAGGPFLYLLALSWLILLAVRFYHGLATAIYAPPHQRW